MSRYIAILHQDTSSKAWGVLVPDFPGCISTGDSFDAALANGAEALAAHIAWMEQDGDSIPEPRDIEAIRTTEDWVDWNQAFVTTIPRLPAPGKKEHIQVTIDAGILTRIDEVSKNRNSFLEEGARRLLAG